MLRQDTDKNNIKYSVRASKHPVDPHKILIEYSAALTIQPIEKEKYVIFVLDKSGSMENTIDLVKEATVGLIHAYLKANDTMSVIAFDNTAREIIPKLIKKNVTPIAIENAISRINAGGGTAIQEGIAKTPVSDIENCTIVLLTDGQNNDPNITVNMILDNLKEKWGSHNIPRIITMGIGEGYNATFLSGFHKAWIPTTIHIKDSSDIKNAFDIVTDFLGERSKCITIHAGFANTNGEDINLGSIEYDVPGRFVVEYTLPNHDAEVCIQNMESSFELKQELLTDQLTFDRDIIALYAVQRMKFINDHYPMQDRLTVLKQEVLPLLMAEKPDDSAFVKDVCQSLALLMQACNVEDENEMRHITSDATTKVVQHRSQPPQFANAPVVTLQQMQQKMISQQEETKVVHDKKTSTDIVSQSLQYDVPLKISDTFYVKKSQPFAKSNSGEAPKPDEINVFRLNSYSKAIDLSQIKEGEVLTFGRNQAFQKTGSNTQAEQDLVDVFATFSRKSFFIKKIANEYYIMIQQSEYESDKISPKLGPAGVWNKLSNSNFLIHFVNDYFFLERNNHQLTLRVATEKDNEIVKTKSDCIFKNNPIDFKTMSNMLPQQVCYLTKHGDDILLNLDLSHAMPTVKDFNRQQSEYSKTMNVLSSTHNAFSPSFFGGLPQGSVNSVSTIDPLNQTMMATQLNPKRM